jgi:hypothetical protein
VHILLKLEYPNGQPVLLDSSKVFWVSQNRFLEQNIVSWSEARAWGHYTIVNDGMRKELQNKEEVMRFTGYLNGEIVCERDVLVGADCCHVHYLGTEPLTQVITLQEESDSSILEVMHKIIPIINDFLAGLSEDLNDEQKLQALTEWLKLRPRIIDATIFCVSCIKALPAESEISISFKENDKTEVFILDILMSNPLKAIRFRESITDDDGDWTNKMAELREHNKNKISITEGIWGTVMKRVGNCIPIVIGEGEDRPSSCKYFPVKREVLIYEYTFYGYAKPSSFSLAFYEKVNTKLIARTTSDEEGFFELALKPGKYSVFVIEYGLLYASSGDGQGGKIPNC